MAQKLLQANQSQFFEKTEDESLSQWTGIGPCCYEENKIDETFVKYNSFDECFENGWKRLFNGVEHSAFVQKRYETYNASIENFDKLTKRIDDTLMKSAINKVVDFIIHVHKPPEQLIVRQFGLPTAVVWSGSTSSTSTNIVFEQLFEILNEKDIRVVSLKSTDCRTMKTALNNLLLRLQQSQLSNHDIPNNEVDLAATFSEWVLIQKNENRHQTGPICIALEDFEQFDAEIIDKLVKIVWYVHFSFKQYFPKSITSIVVSTNHIGSNIIFKNQLQFFSNTVNTQTT